MPSIPITKASFSGNRKSPRAELTEEPCGEAPADEQGIAYIGISDFAAGKPEAGGGLVALRISTGEKLWTTPAPKPSCIAMPGCSAAQPAPVTVIPGVAFLGSWDGHIRAYETSKGAIIWDYDTVQDFQTVNGVKIAGRLHQQHGPNGRRRDALYNVRLFRNGHAGECTAGIFGGR